MKSTSFGLRAALLSTALAGLSSLTTAEAASEAPAASEVIVITGTRGLERTVTNSPTPIDVLAGSDITQSGDTSVLSALNTLVPSFNEPDRAGGSTATVIHTGGLRGLNPDQTLILVNGKRRHATSLINAVSSLYNGSVPVDLDLIPASAIDHIEVLRDGAAAQYGSDAIAGVINIILKSDSKGVTASASAGQNDDRDDGQRYSLLGHAGFDLGGAGFVNFSLSAKDQAAANRAIPISPSISLYNPVGGHPDPREATIDRLVTTNYGTMPQRSIIFGYNAEYHAGDVEFYSDGTVAKRISDLNSTFRAPNNVVSLPEIYPNGFRPREVINEVDYEGIVGVRGSVDGWDWDLSSSYGTNQARLTADHTLNASLGPTGPTTFYLGRLSTSEWVNSLDITRNIDLAGSLHVSAGLQHRLETYAIRDGDVAASAAGTYVIPAGQPNTGSRPAPGVQGATGISTADAGHAARNNLAAYIDLTYDPTPDLTISAAGRVEHYDDSSGDTAIGKFNVRYAVTPWLSLRGDINTGFRAPALAQEIWATTTGQFQLIGGTMTLLNIKALPVNSPSAIALGATPLQPETSLNYSAGVVLTPLDDFILTVDAYSIDVYKRIEPTGTLTGTAVSNILVKNGLPSNISATYFTNAINTRTQGLDTVATYGLDLGAFGHTTLNAGFNYNVNTITHIIPNPTQLSSLGANYVIFDRLSQGNLTTLLPKTKVSLGNSWAWSDFTLTTRAVRYGSYTIRQNAAASDRAFNAKWILDAELAWQATDTFNIAIGADNLLNVYPSANGILNTSLGSQQYGSSPPSPFGFMGGYYYGRLSISL